MKFWYNPTFLAIFFLLILSILALKNLATPGFYTSHDGEAQVARIAQYYQALKDGQFPPRIAGSFYNGIGSPVFVYIYPLPYFLGSVLHFLGFSFTDSFKILMSAGFIFSAIFAYLWLKEVFKNDKSAFLGALFYAWVPYRFLLIYVRASIAETLAYTFLPLFLYFLTKIYQEKKTIWIAPAAISLSLVFLSHNLVALISAVLIFGYIIVLGFSYKSFKTHLMGFLAVIWGFAITSFIYLPAILERKFIKLDEIIQIAFPNHFVSIKQLIHSPWGYGFDLAGFENDQMSFQIGLAHLLLIALAILLIVYFLYRKTKKSQKIDLNLAVFFVIVFGITVLLMIRSPVSILIWENFKLIQIIDIPWRLLGISALCSSFLAAFVAKYQKGGIIFIILVLAVLIANRNHLRINKTVNFNDAFFLNYRETASQYGEFTPIWRSMISPPRSINPDSVAQTISGEAKINTLKNSSNQVFLDIDVFSQNARIRINKIYFPGVKVYLNNTRLEPFRDLIVKEEASVSGITDPENDGLMLINLSRGENKIEIFYGETPLRLFANYLSLSSFVFVLLVIARGLNVKFLKS